MAASSLLVPALWVVMEEALCAGRPSPGHFACPEGKDDSRRRPNKNPAPELCGFGRAARHLGAICRSPLVLQRRGRPWIGDRFAAIAVVDSGSEFVGLLPPSIWRPSRSAETSPPGTTDELPSAVSPCLSSAVRFACAALR